MKLRPLVCVTGWIRCAQKAGGLRRKKSCKQQAGPFALLPCLLALVG